MYCGRCGGFYNQACPHWPQCSPAASPHEEGMSALAWLNVALLASIEITAIVIGVLVGYASLHFGG